MDIHAADVRETQEVERLGLTQPVTLSIPPSETAELDQPRLFAGKLKAELREAIGQSRTHR